MCIIFFFKQKTAYEMRISDWSSDVCSSDLSFSFAPRPAAPAPVAEESIEPEVQEVPFAATETEAAPVAEDRDPAPGFSLNDTAEAEVAAEEETMELRSEERRVGKECVSPGRSRGWALQSKKKKKKSTNQE